MVLIVARPWWKLVSGSDGKVVVIEVAMLVVVEIVLVVIGIFARPGGWQGP